MINDKYMATILDGRALAEKIKTSIKKEITKLGIKPGLAVILVGKDPASEVYVRLKEKAAQDLGIYFEKYLFPEKVSQKKILARVEKLNKEKLVHGIIVQLPLPHHLNTNKIIQTISHKKDVDGFGPSNIEKLFQDLHCFIPPTIAGIIELIKSTKIEVRSKRALIIANSQTFAQPLAFLLKKEGALVETHLKGQRNLKQKARQADILIVAQGKPEFIKPDFIKRGAIVIDVGYSRVKGKPVGDVDPACARRASFISPVPGGVGPMTVAMIFKNVLIAARNQTS